jgi:hypothetical protein
MTASDWGNGDIRAHHRWWLERSPSPRPRARRQTRHWWDYVVDFNSTGAGRKATARRKRAPHPTGGSVTG